MDVFHAGRLGNGVARRAVGSEGVGAGRLFVIGSIRRFIPEESVIQLRLRKAFSN